MGATMWSPSGGLAGLKGDHAFRILLPNQFVRMQRREHYRLAISTANPVKCSIPVDDRMIEVSLIDLSASGVGVSPVNPLDEQLVAEAEFTHCRIDFPDVGTTDLTLRIIQMIQVEQTNDLLKHRAGMEFVNPSRGNQALIQRYMSKLEREFMTLVEER
jgi:c-di-GMP-binding flagellar brake protein YcgR